MQMLLVLGPHTENHCSFLFLSMNSLGVCRYYFFGLKSLFCLHFFVFLFMFLLILEKRRRVQYQCERETSVVSVHAPTGDQT